MFARLLCCVFSAMPTSLLLVCFGTGCLGKKSENAHTVHSSFCPKKHRHRYERKILRIFSSVRVSAGDANCTVVVLDGFNTTVSERNIPPRVILFQSNQALPYRGVWYLVQGALSIVTCWIATADG